jgi:hypothetical protein
MKHLDGECHISDRFKNVVSMARNKKIICIIIDEIEYISPLSTMDIHWHSEFVSFWQTMWTAQSEFRNVSFLIAGVNPTIVEMDQVASIQNPIFSIVPTQYVTGLSDREVGFLLNHIGQWMGLKFDQSAIDYIFERYGGHPLLTRMACSHLHNLLMSLSYKRPYSITRETLLESQEQRESDIAQYSRHVISELSSFYPTEYEMLEMLSSGNIADFIELSSGNDYTRHLRGYGLLDTSIKTKPTIKIPMISTYVNEARARRLRTNTGPHIVPFDHRKSWLSDRVERITSDIRQMERVARDKNMPRLYGANGFPEAERFCSITVCIDIGDFENFINVCNRCFVEPIEIAGTRQGKKDYFWRDVKRSYPDLWRALHRTKLYRNDKMHLLLKKQVEDQLKDMLDSDFFRLNPEEVEDPPFALQQMVIDGLFIGVQAELERLT